VKDELRWPIKQALTEPRDPYNYGRWPGNDNCPLANLAGKRFSRNKAGCKRARNKG
jgi:hypothetical protein